ncbi:DDE domain-containing protein, partial [Legionella israelensis DSM 19235]
KEGNTVDFMFSEKRNERAARTFFIKAMGSNGIPQKVTMDKSGANKAALNTVNMQLALLFILGGIPSIYQKNHSTHEGVQSISRRRSYPYWN